MIVLPFLLMAAEPEIDCANATTQTAMNICSFDDFLAADSTLNAVWKEASAKAKQDEKDSLTAASKICSMRSANGLRFGMQNVSRRMDQGS